jgi:hypothetical protein
MRVRAEVICSFSARQVCVSHANMCEYALACGMVVASTAYIFLLCCLLMAAGTAACPRWCALTTLRAVAELELTAGATGADALVLWWDRMAAAVELGPGDRRWVVPLTTAEMWLAAGVGMLCAVLLAHRVSAIAALWHTGCRRNRT